MFFQLKFVKSELLKVDHVIKSCKAPIDKSIIIYNHILIDIDCIGQSKDYFVVSAIDFIYFNDIIDFMIVHCLRSPTPPPPQKKTCEQLAIGVILCF